MQTTQKLLLNTNFQNKLWLKVVAIYCSCLGSTLVQATGTFDELNNAPSVSTAVNGISADGNTAVGFFENSNGIYEAALWNNGTMTGLKFLGVVNESYSYSVSGDGSVVVGSSRNNNNYMEAFRWTSGTGMRGLGSLNTSGSGNYNSWATSVSADGSNVAGYSMNNNGDAEAFRWNNGTMTGLGFLNTGGSGRYVSRANAISADGSTVVGISVNGEGYNEAFRWNNGSMIGLGFLRTTSGYYDSWANAVSGDGSIVVGYSQNNNDNREAFRWSSATGMTGLGFLNTSGSGSYNSIAVAVSSDGGVVVGASANNLGYAEPFRWTSATGMQSIATWLTDAGVTPTDTFLTSIDNYAAGVSADGNVVVGNYYDDNEASHAWLARVDGDGSGSGLLVDLAAFNSSLIESGSRNIQAGTGMPNMTLFGAHHRSILDNGLARSDNNGTCAWATTDAAHHNSISTNTELAEVGACKDFGNSRFGIGIGQAWTQQSLSLDGSARYNGQYLLMEGAKAFDNGLQPSVTGYYGRFDSKMSRHYMNGAGVDSSNASPNSNVYALRARLDWKDAKTIGRFSISPYAAYTWIKSKLDAYTETGGGFPAHFAASTWTTNDLRAGTAVKTALSTATDLRLGAEVAHRFENNTSGVKGNVVDLWSFNLPGKRITQTWMRATIDVDHRVTNNVALTVGANTATTGGDASWGVTAGLRANF